MSETLFKGTPVKLAGKFVEVGAKAPKFSLIKGDLSIFNCEEVKGNYLVLNIFPSLDTEVCANSVRKFNTQATSLPDVRVLAISKDLPFAQSRFCTIEGIKHIIPLSDFRYNSTFGTDYGVLMTSGPLNGLLARAVVIIHPDGKIIYTELVTEITKEPNYESALEAIHLHMGGK